MTPDTPVRAAAYLRVSDQSATSLQGQLTEARKTATAQGWTLADKDVFTETMSASIYGRRAGKVRTAWADFLERIPEVGAVILPEISRATRELGVYDDLAELINRHQTRVCVKNRVINLEDDSDFVMSGIEIVMAAGESKRISRRVKRGNLGANEAGRAPAGRVPFPFVRPARKPGERAVQAPDQEAADAVRDAATGLLDGCLSTGQVAEDWAIRFPAETWGKKWSRKLVRDTMRNPALIGKRVHLGTWHPAEWDPILDLATFDKLNELFESRKFVGSRVSTTLLSWVARCGICGEPLQFKRRKNDKAEYRCRVKGCCAVYREFLDEAVVKTVIRVIQFQALCLLRDEGEHSPDTEAWNKSVTEVERAKTEHSEFLVLSANSGLTARDKIALGVEYRKALEKAETEERRLRAALSEDRSSPEMATEIVEHLLATNAWTEGPTIVMEAAYQAAEQSWAKQTLIEQRQTVKDTFTVHVFPKHSGKRRIRIGFLPGAVPDGVVDLNKVYADLPRTWIKPYVDPADPWASIAFDPEPADFPNEV